MGLYKLRTDFGHHMKWLLIVIAGGFLVGGLFVFTGYGPGGSGGPEGSSPTDVIATVGEMEITKGEMEAAWERQANVLADQQGIRSTLQHAQRRGQLFQSMVADRITLAMADELGVQVSDDDVEKKIGEFVVAQLRISRRSVMGKMSATEEKTDPRYDRAFARELGKIGRSVSQIEDGIRASIPEDTVKSQLAQQGIQAKIKQRAGTVTPKDVTDSYNVYSVRQIVVPKGSMPAGQLRTRVEKIMSQARAGGDFSALAKQYSQDKGKGGVGSISFDNVLNIWMMTQRGGAQFAPYVKSSLDIYNHVSKIKPGQVGEPVDTDQAVYIVKVENATPKLPAKLDKKAKDERKGMIEDVRAWQEGLDVEQRVRKEVAVKVNDPEFLGYWELSQMGQSMSGPDQMKVGLRKAKTAFKKAVVQNPNNSYATAMLAVVLAQMGDSKQAIGQLYSLLEGANSKGEGADLRILLGDLLLQSGRDYQVAKKPKDAAEAKDAGLKQYAKASEIARLDPGTHQQLAAKYQQIGRRDLAAKEQQAAADIDAKLKLVEAERAKAQGSRTPAPKPMPAGP